MRIKISASTDSTTTCDFWYVLDDKAAQNDTVHDLKKKINATLPLTTKARYLNLSLEGFQLLPTSPLNGLIRDGDIIKIERGAGKLKNKKSDLVSKHLSTSATDIKSKIDKTKTTQKKKVDTTKTKSEKRKRKDVSTDHQQSTVDTNAKRQKKDKSKKQHDSKDTSLATTAPTTTPVSKSKARNLRRTKTRQARRENKLEAVKSLQQPEESSTVPVSATTTTANSTHSAPPTSTKHNHNHNEIDDDINEPPREISSKTHVEPPRHLLKQNKNKKKNFLKQMDRNSQSQHVVFDESVVKDEENDGTDTVVMDKQVDEIPEPNHDLYDGDDGTSEQPFYDITNTHGGAFITESESQHVRNKNKQQRNYMNRQYPVDELEPVFLAIDEEQDENEKMEEDDTSSRSSSDSSDSSDSDSSSSGEEEEEEEEEEKVEPKRAEKVDYEQYPAITLQGLHAPVVGDHLAIKTLHLSESYTPEISDWKEIKVVELTDEEMVVEYIGQANPSPSDVQRGRLRKFDLPPEYEQENGDDLKNSINYQDLLEMRRISN